jgi:hypothetical protein
VAAEQPYNFGPLFRALAENWLALFDRSGWSTNEGGPRYFAWVGQVVSSFAPGLIPPNERPRPPIE